MNPGLFHREKQITVNTLSYKTKSRRKEDVERKWYIVDAENQIVGRLCSNIASVLRGKHRPDYTPHVDCGDHVIVINADKVRFTGKKWSDKIYEWYTGYPGGRKERTAMEMRDKKAVAIVENAIRGMLPKNSLGRDMFRKLYVYEGAEHPHQAQKPEPLKF